jgi:hypothetical protein
MKIVTEEKIIPEHKVTTTKYIASDGKEFSTEDACLVYEGRIEINNHPVFKNCITDILTFDNEHRCNLYYLSNKDDYEFLVKNLGFTHTDVVNSEFDDYGKGWYLYWNESCSYYADHHYIRNYNVYVKEIESELKEWKENIEEKIEQRYENRKYNS